MTTDLALSLPSSETVTRVVLDNGITVLVYPKSSVSSVVIAGSLPAGGLSNPPEKSGLASLAAEALLRGTQNRDFETLHTELEVLGADLDFDAGRYKTTFNGKSLAEDLPNLLELLGDTLRYPTFPAQQVERLRGEALTALNYYQLDTRYRARRAFYEALYPETHPYHYSTSGTLETVKALTVDDMKTFHATHYGPKGMIVVVVGNVDVDQAVDHVRTHLGDWANADHPGRFPTPDAPVVEEARRVFTPVPGKTQSDIVVGLSGPSRYEPDYQAAVLVNSVLGQFGMMGRIGDVVREQKGMAYYSRSSIEGGHGPGAWLAYAGVNPENVDEAVTDIIDAFRNITEATVTDDELSDVQAYYTGNLPLQLESNNGIANILLRLESYQLGLDYLVDYHEVVNGLTQADLQTAAKKYIRPDALVVSVAGPDRK